MVKYIIKTPDKNQQMNIAFISYWSCPLTKLGVLNSGGMSVYLLNLANELSILGHQVHIFTRAHSRTDENELVTHKSVKIIHLPQKEKDLYQDIYRFAQGISAYCKINKINYDIIHSHYFYSGLVAIELQKEYRIPHVFTFHSLGKFEKNYDAVKTEKRIGAEKFIVKNADGIVVSTEAERSSITENYQGSKNKIYIISPGVDHRIFKKMHKGHARKLINIPGNLKVILFIGRIDPNKGINILLEAVSILVDKYPDYANKYRVILIGGDTESDEFWENKEVIKIKDIIRTKKLSCCVKFIGNKFHGELPIYYSAADLVIIPSYHESFGLVALEAMSSGAAVIASKVGGLSYLIKEGVTGRFFKSGDTLGLSEIIWELLNDDKQRLKLGNKAIVESKKYCWNIQAERIVKIYKSLVCPVEKFRK